MAPNKIDLTCNEKIDWEEDAHWHFHNDIITTISRVVDDVAKSAKIQKPKISYIDEADFRRIKFHPRSNGNNRRVEPPNKDIREYLKRRTFNS